MRDLLFRGKSRENGDWYEGNLEINKYYRYSSEEKDYRIVDRNCGIDDDGFAYYQSGCDESCDPKTIGQFTGLFDKNGTKIFEGDIIEFGSRNLVVWWDQEKFQWRAKAVLDTPTSPYESFRDKEWDDIDLGWIYAELPSIGKITTTIIGNIHDNPEMLNV